MYICVTPKPTFDFNKILCQQCTIYWQYQTVKFQLNLPKETTVTAAFVRSP